MYLGCRLWNGEDYGQEGKKESLPRKPGWFVRGSARSPGVASCPSPPERRQPFLGHGGYVFNREK